MLNVQIAPHREFLPADYSEQKLFVMLKLRPKKEVAKTPAAHNLCFSN